MRDRIQKEIESQSLTYSDLERLTGVSKSTWHRYLSSDTYINSMPLDKFEALAEALNVSYGYLSGWTDDRDDAVTAPKFVEIPKVSATPAAGHGSWETSDEIEDFYSFRTDWLRGKGKKENLVLMNVDGHSMSPLIQHNDLIMVDKSRRELLEGAIYLVRVEDLIFIKYIDRMPGEIILKSYNPKFEPKHIKTEYLTDTSVEILGRVIWWCHDELPIKR